MKTHRRSKMRIQDIHDNVRTDVYECKSPYVTHMVDPVAWQKYCDEEVALDKQFRSDLKVAFETELGRTLTEDAWNAIFLFVWEEGHAAGLEEVCRYASELQDIVKVVLA